MTAKKTDLAAWLRESRARTLDLVRDLTDDELMARPLDTVNPFLWEIGHVAWFHEKWLLRVGAGLPPVRDDADRLYDSSAVAHDTRWDLPLPSRAETFGYMQAVLDRILDRFDAGAVTDEDAYHCAYTVHHEDMHAEAFTYTRQTLGHRAPAIRVDEAPLGGGALAGDASVPGGTFSLGATPDAPFVFDNEKWSHPVALAPFRIARAPVTNAEFRDFVDDRGYDRRELWSDEGWAWRESAGAEHPLYWRREPDGRWGRRHFDRWIPLGDAHPVIHVSWFEADAWCRWAGRRLPAEGEWEAAASGGPGGRKPDFPWGDEPAGSDRANLDWRGMGTAEVGACAAGDGSTGCRQMIGNVWEWTATDFGPYPGFVPDFYAEYSAPWFGDRKVLRGGCWATRSRLIRNTWRNYFTPDRRDIFAGFRTCARERA